MRLVHLGDSKQSDGIGLVDTRHQRLPRGRGRLHRARRQIGGGCRGGAVSAHQTLGRLPVAGDRLLPAGSQSRFGRREPRRRQPQRPRQSLSQARLYRLAPAERALAVEQAAQPQTARRHCGRGLGALPGRPFSGAIDYVEHHLAHLASAFYPSPFRDAVVASVDGFGDFASAAWGCGSGTALSLDGRVLFPHSLGIFYQAMTQYLGFPHYGDEYKLMGLAAYGDSSCRKEVERLVSLRRDGAFALDLKYFRHQSEDVAYEWQGGEPVCGPLFSQGLVEALGPPRRPNSPIADRHRNLAWATQSVYEDAFFHLLNSLQRRYGHSAVALAGGCAYNSVANGKIRDRTGFRQCYLQSAAGDAGGAIGAAYAVWHRSGARTAPMTHAFWGPSFTDNDIGALLSDRRAAIAAEGCSVRRVEDEKDLVDATARAIADGLVVGWFQGRMEWGPRALGNRSILGDPRRADMKDILNLKIKRREFFPPLRPFGPARGRRRLVRA